METKVFIVYSGNSWFSYNSLEIRYICDTYEEAVEAIIGNHEIRPEDLFEDIDFLEGASEEEIQNIVADEIREQLDNNRGQITSTGGNFCIMEYNKNEWQ